MKRAKILLTDHSIADELAELPGFLRGDLSEASLSDLSWLPEVYAAWRPYGLWPIRDMTVLQPGETRAETYSDTANTELSVVDRTYDAISAPLAAIWVKPDEFVDLFTAAEVDAIYASSNLEVRKWRRRLEVRIEPIQVNSETIAEKLAALEALGLIGVGRAAQIVTGQAPA